MKSFNKVVMDKEIYQSPYRWYRTEKIHSDTEQKIQIVIEESDLLLTLTDRADAKKITEFCTKKLCELRSIIKFWIKMYPQIQHSLDPVACPENAPPCISIMCRAAAFAHVGPFAAVAGTVAQYMAGELHAYLNNAGLPDDVLAENGGDIYCFSRKERIIGILANPRENCTLGLKIPKEQFPLAVCSSSATIGHSLSFGNGDLALVTAKNASLADALATRYGNLLKTRQDIGAVLEQAQKDRQIRIENDTFIGDTAKQGLSGVFVQIDDTVGAWGDVELTAIR